MLTMQGPFIQPWPYWFSIYRIRESEKIEYSVRTHKQAIHICTSTFELEYAVQIYISNNYTWLFSSFRILAGCRFTGNIPDELGNLGELTFL